jgi:FixJ family two-component response regulator
MSPNPVVCVVDDDESVRESLVGLLGSVQIEAVAFARAEEFLSSNIAARTSCLILDIRLETMGGLELQQRLLESGDAPPIVFITATGDERSRRLALGRGALAYLNKPFDEEQLLVLVELARERRRG